MLGPHTHTPAPTACDRWSPTTRPVGGQFGEGERLTTDAPHNGEGTPPGDALPPPPQRATPACKGARCGAGAGSPLPQRPHLGHTGRGTPAARPRGQAAGRGTAPDTRRPSQQWQATPPGDGLPPPPRHAAFTGHAGQGDSVGPPHPHTRAHSTWVAEPNSPPSGRAVGGGGAPDLRRPSQRRKAPPPGMPFRHPHSEQRRPARAHAVGPMLGPHDRNDRTWDTRVAEPRLPAREDGGRGEGQRLTPDAPHNGGRPPPPGDCPPLPPRHAAPTGHAGQGDGVGPPRPHTRAHSMWVADPNSPPSVRAVRGGVAPDGRRPSQRWKAPPWERPCATPTASNAGPQGRTLCGRCWFPRPHRPHPNTRVAEPRPPAREDGRPGEGQRLKPDAPHNRGGPPSPGTAPHHPRGTQTPQGMQAKGDSDGPQNPHARARSTRVTDPNNPPSGRAVGRGGAPDLRRPSQRWKAPPAGTPSATPTASNAGLQGRTLWGRFWVPTPARTAPGTSGWRNPGYPPQRTDGRGRDSA